MGVLCFTIYYFVKRATVNRVVSREFDRFNYVVKWFTIERVVFLAELVCVDLTYWSVKSSNSTV